ncbi:MAG: hypothetical protein PUE01_08245 [Clostridiaceae bacterium]|nr:hypothetical protein [Clostridiaceae bacterium]
MNKFFDEYKELTKRIIESLDKGEPNEDLMTIRGQLLEKIDSLGYSSIEMKEFYYREKIDELDKKLYNSLQNAICNVKQELDKVNRAKDANKGYANVMRQGSFYSRMV